MGSYWDGHSSLQQIVEAEKEALVRAAIVLHFVHDRLTGQPRCGRMAAAAGLSVATIVDVLSTSGLSPDELLAISSDLDREAEALRTIERGFGND